MIGISQMLHVALEDKMLTLQSWGGLFFFHRGPAATTCCIPREDGRRESTLRSRLCDTILSSLLTMSARVHITKPYFAIPY